MKTFLFYALFIVLGAVSCSKSDPPKTGDDDGTEQTAIPDFENFAPTQGSEGSVVLIRGEHFGNDVSNVLVTVGGQTAVVNYVSDTRIEFTMPAGKGDLKIFVQVTYGGGNTVSYTFDQTFHMVETTTSISVETAYTGLNQPTRIRFDDQGDIFVANASGISRISNGIVSEIYNASTTDQFQMGTLREIFFSPDYQTLYVINEQWIDGVPSWPYLVSFARSEDFKTLHTELEGMVGGMFGLAVNPLDGEVFITHAYTSMVSRFDRTVKEQQDLFRTVPEVGYFWFFNSLVFSPDGRKLYAAQYHSGTLANVLTIDYDLNLHALDGASMTVIAGEPDVKDGATGYLDGNSTDARFNEPVVGDFDADGNFYIADSQNHCIRKITPEGTVTTLAGIGGMYGSSDGNEETATFNVPQHVQFGPDGALYVADQNNSSIRKIVFD